MLSTAAGNPTAISGTARGDNDTTFRIDFYQNTACDPSGSGEGESYLGSTDVTIDAGGEATFAAVPGQTVDLDAVITATATDPDDNTSEFSNCISVGPVVDSTGDAPDATPGDRLCDDGAEACTLRAAIQGSQSGFQPYTYSVQHPRRRSAYNSAQPRIAGDNRTSFHRRLLAAGGQAKHKHKHEHHQRQLCPENRAGRHQCRSGHRHKRACHHSERQHGTRARNQPLPQLGHSRRAQPGWFRDRGYLCTGELSLGQMSAAQRPLATVRASCW